MANKATRGIRVLAIMLAMLSLAVLPMRAFAQTATEVSGEAFGIEATGVVTIPPTPRVTLPLTGGNETDNVARVDQAGITTGVLEVSTSGTLDPAASTATATVNNLAVSTNVAGVATPVVTATTLTSTSDSFCNEDGTADSEGESTVEDLTLLGEDVEVTGVENQTVTADLPGNAGTVTLVINEQAREGTDNMSELTVNALRVTVTIAGTTQQTVVVASATSDIVCAPVEGDEDDQQGGDDDQQDGDDDDQQGGDDEQDGGELPDTGGAAVPVGQSLYTAGAAIIALAGMGVMAIRRRS
ncbi:MAG: hypothetical protein M3Q29_06315 [Chloroflexota bacterium]|nr:hypothetical protein [Chloroflexota bacterium]